MSRSIVGLCSELLRLAEGQRDALLAGDLLKAVELQQRRRELTEEMARAGPDGEACREAVGLLERVLKVDGLLKDLVREGLNSTMERMRSIGKLRAYHLHERKRAGININV